METLTVYRLHVSGATPADAGQPTNVIESAFSTVETVCRNVKRWRVGDQRERWVGSALFVAEQRFRRVKGHNLIPHRLKELEALAASKSAAANRRKAS